MRGTRLLWRIYSAFLLLTMVSLTVVLLYVSGMLRSFYHERVEKDLVARARLIELQVAGMLAEDDLQRIDATCKALGESSATRITVILPSGEVVADSDHDVATMDNHRGRPEIQRALSGQIGNSYRYSHTLDKEMAYVALPIESDGELAAILRTSIPLVAIDQAMGAVHLRLVVGGLVVAMFGALVSLILSRRITKPLEEIQQGARRFAAGDLRQKLTVPDTEETGALAETLNHMATELEERIRTTERQRNESEAILSSMDEGVVAVNAEQRIVNMNQAAARLFHVDADEVLGRRLSEAIHSEELQRLVQNVLKARDRREDEIVLQREEDSYLHIHGTVLRGSDDEQSGVLIVLHDVTRIKRLEKIRRDFVANVSHELKTPITSIKGYVETLLDGAMQDHDDAVRFLRVVAGQADRLNAIIVDLLSLSELEKEEGDEDIGAVETSLQDILRAAVEMTHAKAEDCQIRVEMSCDPGIKVFANTSLMEEAVANLVSNACNYSPAGEVVRVQGSRAGTQVEIRVIDHGCGIAREHLSRIFERFYRVDKARSRKHGGTGLGLSIVKHIAQVHGGRASVVSEPGKGSTFSIWLPSA